VKEITIQQIHDACQTHFHVVDTAFPTMVFFSEYITDNAGKPMLVFEIDDGIQHFHASEVKECKGNGVYLLGGFYHNGIEITYEITFLKPTDPF